MASFLGMISLITCGVLCKGWEMPYGVQNMNGFTGFKRNNIPDPALDAQKIGNPLPSAFFEEQITGGRHPNDDKRFTIEQLNHAARHRNVYYDTVGGDPYGNSSPVLSRSHVGHPHKRRSVLQTGGMAAPGAVSTFYPAAQSKPSISKTAEKRYSVADLNYAARHRNVYFDTIGGDPYGSSSNVLTRQQILIHHKRAAENNDNNETKVKQLLKKKLRVN